jgi:hypothetical protein
MNITDNFSESLQSVLGLKILKFLDAELDPGSRIRNLFDPGSGIRMEKFVSGIRIGDPRPGIWDKHPGSAPLL